MDRYNNKRVEKRNYDTLQGMVRGVLADERLGISELQALQDFVNSNALDQNPLAERLVDQIFRIEQPRDSSDEDRQSVAESLLLLCGENPTGGEIKPTAEAPFSDPVPEIIFGDRSFLLTGKFKFGTRTDCKMAIEGEGGIVAKRVTKTLDYLIVGSYATESWVHDTAGNKILQAVKYVDQGVDIKIIREDDWVLDHWV